MISTDCYTIMHFCDLLFSSAYPRFMVAVFSNCPTKEMLPNGLPLFRFQTNKIYGLLGS